MHWGVHEYKSKQVHIVKQVYIVVKHKYTLLNIIENLPLMQ